MRRTTVRRLGATAAFVSSLFVAICGPQRTVGQEIPDPLIVPDALNEPRQDDVEVLTRGPIHEAFATQVTQDGAAGPVVMQAPPEPINELPPDVRPDGDDIDWITGYWAFDEDASRYIWVSGVWRAIPPGRRWVPGYWTEVTLQTGETGYQWVSGFWNDANAQIVEYHAQPPATLEVGPSSTAPLDDTFWVPGSWTPTSTGYAWQAGYWNTYRDDWVWVPAHYVWTPRGCVYVAGFWDYRFPDRGEIFAPIYVSPQVCARPAFAYRPWYVLNTPNVFIHLFISPLRHHYYFGDYYGTPYWNRQYYPYAYYHQRGYGYDPLFVFYRQYFRHRGVDYAYRLHGWHQYFDHHQDHRPRHTAKAQYAYVDKHRDLAVRNQLTLTHSLKHEWENRKGSPGDGSHRTLVQTDSRRREMADLQRSEWNELRQYRQSTERTRNQHGKADLPRVKGDPSKYTRRDSGQPSRDAFLSGPRRATGDPRANPSDRVTGSSSQLPSNRGNRDLAAERKALEAEVRNRLENRQRSLTQGLEDSAARRRITIEPTREERGKIVVTPQDTTAGERARRTGSPSLRQTPSSRRQGTVGNWALDSEGPDSRIPDGGSGDRNRAERTVRGSRMSGPEGNPSGTIRQRSSGPGAREPREVPTVEVPRSQVVPSPGGPSDRRARGSRNYQVRENVTPSNRVPRSPAVNPPTDVTRRSTVDVPSQRTLRSEQVTRQRQMTRPSSRATTPIPAPSIQSPMRQSPPTRYTQPPARITQPAPEQYRSSPATQTRMRQPSSLAPSNRTSRPSTSNRATRSSQPSMGTRSPSRNESRGGSSSEGKGNGRSGRKR